MRESARAVDGVVARRLGSRTRAGEPGHEPSVGGSSPGDAEPIPGTNRHTPSTRGDRHECKPLKQNGLQSSG